MPERLVDTAPDSAANADPLSLRAVERRHVGDVLRREGGNKQRTAKVLGISRRALYRLIEKYGLESGTASQGGLA